MVPTARCGRALQRVRYKRHPPKHARTTIRADKTSAANAELLDQMLVAALVGALEIIEQLATLRDELEQAAPRVVVFHVRLEMLREVVDAFRQDRDLHLGGAGV